MPEKGPPSPVHHHLGICHHRIRHLPLPPTEESHQDISDQRFRMAGIRERNSILQVSSVQAVTAIHF